MAQLDQSVIQIHSILAAAKRHFLYSDELNKRVLGALNQDALVHSNQLEPDADHTKTLKRLKEAWEYGVEYFQDHVNIDLILKLAHIVEPKNHGTFRTSMGFTKDRDGSHVCFTNPMKISRDLGQLLFSLEERHEDPIVQAAQLHLYMGIIHPLSDGNGGTSRLLQNLLLHHYGVPPAIIRSTDRATYLNHIEDAHRGFKERNDGTTSPFENYSYPELRFLQYIVDRVMEATVKLSDEIISQRRYNLNVEVKGCNRNIYSLRNAIRDSLCCRGIPPQIRSSPKDCQMIVVTSASEEEMIGIIEKYKMRNTALVRYVVTETTNIK